MKPCPACQKTVEDDSMECLYCGIIFAKWKARHSAKTSELPPASEDRLEDRLKDRLKDLTRDAIVQLDAGIHPSYVTVDLIQKGVPASKANEIVTQKKDHYRENYPSLMPPPLRQDLLFSYRMLTVLYFMTCLGMVVSAGLEHVRIALTLLVGMPIINVIQAWVLKCTFCGARPGLRLLRMYLYHKYIFEFFRSGALFVRFCPNCTRSFVE